MFLIVSSRNLKPVKPTLMTKMNAQIRWACFREKYLRSKTTKKVKTDYIESFATNQKQIENRVRRERLSEQSLFSKHLRRSGGFSHETGDGGAAVFLLHHLKCFAVLWRERCVYTGRKQCIGSTMTANSWRNEFIVLSNVFCFRW